MNIHSKSDEDICYDNETIDILNLIRIIWEKRKVLAVINVIGILGSIFFALNQENQFVSIATFVPVKKPKTEVNTRIDQLADLTEIRIAPSSDERVNFEVILESRQLAKRVINRLNILDELLALGKEGRAENLQLHHASEEEKKENDITTPNMHNSEDEIGYFNENLAMACKILRSSVIDIDKESSGLFKVQATMSDPVLASKIANAYLDELDAYLQQRNLTSLKNRRMFIESQLRLAKKQLIEYKVQLKEHYEAQLKELNEKYGIFRVDYTAAELSETIGKAKLEIVLEELASLSLKYGQLKQELAIQQEIYKKLRMELETAKIEEAEDSRSILVIDRAIPAELTANANKKVIVFVGVVASFVFSLLLIFTVEMIKNVRRKL